MLYVSYSQAFKSGVYNLTATSAATIGPVNPERLDAYEVGLKSELFDRTVRFNASIFHYNFKDLQVQSYAGGTATLLLLNAAQARYTGIDIDAVWAVTPRFQLGAKTLFMDAEYSSFPVYAGFMPRTTSNGGNVAIAGGVNLTGRRPARSPEFSGTFTASYKLPLASGAQFMLNGLVNHTSSYSFTPDATLRSPSYSTVDGSIEFTSADGVWKASVWAKNLTDKYYYNYMQVNNVGTYGIAAAPRTFGATVAVKFGGKEPSRHRPSSEADERGARNGLITAVATCRRSDEGLR
jgi:iron complex outermembrane receptor protein